MAKWIYTKNHTYKCGKCGYEYKQIPPEDPNTDNGCPNCWMIKASQIVKGEDKDANIQ